MRVNYNFHAIFLVIHSTMEGFFMTIKQYLFLGLFAVFAQMNAYKIDYFDQGLARDSEDLRSRHWVSCPTGHSQIGKTVRRTMYNASAGAHISGSQTLSLHIWYPIYHGEIFTYVRYRDWDNEWIKKQLIRRGFSHEDVFKFDDLCCRAENEYPFSTVSEKLPVIFFCPGDLGTLVADYTAICEELASRHYIVVAVENIQHNRVVIGDVLCAYEQLMKFNGDTEDMFHNRVDFGRVGIMGHLYGGSVAYKLCREDIRFRAGISLDGVPFGIEKMHELYGPFKFLFSEFTCDKNRVLQEVLERRHLTQVLHAEIEIIPQLKPLGFSDLVILKDLPPYNSNKHLLDLEAMTGAVDGVKTMAIINEYIVDFFKRCLT